MNIGLVITNLGALFTVIVLICLGLTVYLKRPEKNADANIAFAWFAIAAVIWQIFYAVGINSSDPYTSRAAFMISIFAGLFIVLANVNLVLTLTGRKKGREKVLYLFYFLALVEIIFYTIFPDRMLLPSTPALYLPNFFVPGDLFNIQDYIFFGAFVYLLYEFFVSYKRADIQMRNRLKYFIIAYLYGYSVALVPEFLAYGIEIDPLPAAFAGLFGIPMAYAILKYEALNVNILARRALGYAFMIVGVALFIFFTGYANNYVHIFIPNFPEWVLPLTSGIIAVSIGVFVWNKIKEVEILNYQFIDVVTHKFRTPLTYIKWSIDTLRSSEKQDERSKAVSQIDEANAKLYELTDTLLAISGSDDSQYLYNIEPENIKDLVQDILRSVKWRLDEKKIIITNDISNDLPKVMVDRRKFQFALQMIIENAITYSPQGGEVRISAELKRGNILLSVKDSGIGIAKEDIPRLFFKFYRGTNASKRHTEGLGIGLYLAHEIMARHGGSLYAESLGEGSGSTFFFRIPCEKKLT